MTPRLMDPDTAYAVVQQRVYNPVFFEKLASTYGIHARTPEEQGRMLTMAGQLRAAHDQQLQKQAATRNPLDAAQRHLNAQMTKMGYATVQQQQAPLLVKQAAAQASYDPELAHAILSMQAVSNGVTEASLAAV